MKNRSVIFYSLSIFWILFMKGTWFGFNPMIDGWIKNALSCFLLMSLLFNIKNFLGGKYKYINVSLLLFCVISYVSALINFDDVNALNVLGRSGGEIIDLKAQIPKSVLYQMISLLATAYFIEKFSEIGKIRLMIKTVFYALLLLLVFVDIDAFTTIDVETGNSYLIGNKFAVTYSNIYICVLYALLNPEFTRKSRILFYILAIITFLVSLHTECSTALMGIVLYIALVEFIPQHIKLKLYSLRTLFLSLFICDILFFFFTTWFLQFPIVQDFIVDVLHEDLTLTGRLIIYEKIQEAFAENPWLGYGAGNSSVISVLYTGFYDAQNGLVDMFVQVGILGCIAFLSFLYSIFRYLKVYNTSITNKSVYPIIAFVYIMIAISMVEIPFNNKFIFFTMLLLTNSTKDFKIVHNGKNKYYSTNIQGTRLS